MSTKESTTTSISTSTSTTTTTTTPVKVIDKNNKVEAIKETTTTTTKTTTTTVTPIKEEAKKTIVRNETWKDGSEDHIHLVRDFYYRRYNGKTKATEIHADPHRNYSKFNLQTVQRKVREVRMQVDAYHQGAWVDAGKVSDFKERCQLHLPPTDDEKKGREEEYKRFEKLQSDVDDVLGGFVALSVKSTVVEV